MRVLPVLPFRPVLPDSPIAAVQRARSVRISVTDRCDMACVYCRPSHGEDYLPASHRLDERAWERLVHGLAAAGVRRVRITGGEPLIAPGIVSLVRRLASLGLEDLAMTTNGTQLARLAPALRVAGLQRVNVSLDSLRHDTFASLTRSSGLDAVKSGLEAARSCGFDEIKTNTVVVRDANDDELGNLTAWAWARGITPRFIELMAVGEGAKLAATRTVPYHEMRIRLAPMLADDDAVFDPDRGPARYVSSRDGRHRVGFITGTTQSFCATCDRLRVTSDGVMRPCLARNDGLSVAEALTHDEADVAIATTLHAAWAMKPDASWRGCSEPPAEGVSMRATGG